MIRLIENALNTELESLGFSDTPCSFQPVLNQEYDFTSDLLLRAAKKLRKAPQELLQVLGQAIEVVQQDNFKLTIEQYYLNLTVVNYPDSGKITLNEASEEFVIPDLSLKSNQEIKLLARAGFLSFYNSKLYQQSGKEFYRLDDDGNFCKAVQLPQSAIALRIDDCPQKSCRGFLKVLEHFKSSEDFFKLSSFTYLYQLNLESDYEDLSYAESQLSCKNNLLWLITTMLERIEPVLSKIGNSELRETENAKLAELKRLNFLYSYFYTELVQNASVQLFVKFVDIYTSQLMDYINQVDYALRVESSSLTVPEQEILTGAKYRLCHILDFKLT